MELSESLEGKFIDAMHQAHALVDVDLSVMPPQNTLDRDESCFDAWLQSENPEPKLRIWTNTKCLVVTRRQTRHPNFEKARLIMMKKGWPVVVRRSGGSTVVHRRGVLNVSLYIGWSDIADWQGLASGYHQLLSLMQTACHRIGVKTSVGPSPKSYCDGAYNLLFESKKLAGTAARIRRSDNRIGQLVHASLVISGDVKGDMESVFNFEHVLGETPDYDPKSMTTLAHACK